MNGRRKKVAGAAGVFLLALLASLPGCSRHLTSAFIPNQRPELEILDARADRANPAAVRVRWAARDADGTVARCVWTLAPLRRAMAAQASMQPSATATSPAARECVLARRAPALARVAGASRPEPDLFTIWAVDDRGAESDHKVLALFDSNIAPTVVITCPTPSALSTLSLGSHVTFGWTGTDPDGITTNRPVKYKYKLLPRGNTEFDIDYARFNPDSLRRYYAERNFAGWDSTGGDTMSVHYSGLTPNQTYLFVVTGFDEVGDYDPVFNFSKNMVTFQAVLESTLGPRLTMWNSEFFYSYSSGGWSTDASRIVNVEEPADAPLAFNVMGTGTVSSSMAGYRWALDSADPSDPTVRTDPADLRHWSAWSTQTRIALGSFSPPANKRQSHTLYIEGSGLPSGCAGDPASGFISLGIIHFIVVRGTYSHELLIVDDTRLESDQFISGVRKPYSQVWPARAELDTFLFARGGYPWLGALQPSGALTTPGVFAGYSYDTLGTRGVFSGPIINGVPSGSVPLSTLADYRHVIWMVDHNGGAYTSSPVSLVQPMSTLHYMNTPGHLNGLAEYIALGGKVWLMGGGGALASLREYNAIGADNNDRDYAPINGFVFAGEGYAHHAGKEELTPGRMMFDDAHWRSLMMCQVATARINASTSVTTNPDARWLDQPGYAFANPVHRPDYTLLPAQMHVHTNPASDPVNGEPIPPTRATTYSGNWWSTAPTVDVEYLLQPNLILEDMNPAADAESLQAALDTLMSAHTSNLVGGGTGYEPAVMTWYHGVQTPEFVFSGFPVWSWRRADCQQLVDFVLQQIWHMSKSTSPATPLARRGLVPDARSAPAPASGRVHLPTSRAAGR
jgi:hypothetical protein